MKLAIVWVALGLLFSHCAHADHYRTGSLEELMGVPNWELVRQDFDVVTGDDYGKPILIAKYSTLAGCDKAQRGRISKPHNVGVKWVVGKFLCRHKGDDVV